MVDVKFERECADQIAAQGADTRLAGQSADWIVQTAKYNYSYHFRSFGLPIIQYPHDIVVLQELIWSVQPDIIIETGVARGGSLIMNAAMLAVLDYCDAAVAGKKLDPSRPGRRVIGIDNDIRPENRVAIEAHPLASRIGLIQGSSTDPEIIRRVSEQVINQPKQARVLVCLDSNHTHEHVFAELGAYGVLVTPGSYCIVFDTVIEDMPTGSFPNRPWDKGNNPKTAVWAFLASHPEFEIDTAIADKLLVTAARDGYLRRKDRISIVTQKPFER
jgi:cephalosporin hydroxylase